MPAAYCRAGLPWQRAPPSTCAEEPPAFLAAPFRARFGALAVQLAPSRRDERSVWTEDGPSGIFLYQAALSCLTAMPLTPLFISIIRIFSSFGAVFCVLSRCPLHVPGPACPWALSPLQPLQSHPAWASCSKYSLHSKRQLVPGWSGAMHVLMSCLAILEGDILSYKLARSYVCWGWPAF